jgi:hypothetical protein
MPIIRPIKVHESETLEIQWTLKDNSIFVERHTIPPKSTREYREESKD